MNLVQYQQNTQRTCPSLGSKELDNAHMIYGMVSELEELDEAIKKQDNINIGEEITDGRWYLTNYCRINGVDISRWDSGMCGYPVGMDLFKELAMYLSRLCDKEKRELVYKKEFDSKEKHTICWWIWNLQESLYLQYKLNPQQCMQNNIDKLMKRYPDKFQENLALNRDLIAERKELEK